MLFPRGIRWRKRSKLLEAVELFLECATEEELGVRLDSESFVSSLEVEIA